MNFVKDNFQRLPTLEKCVVISKPFVYWSGVTMNEKYLKSAATYFWRKHALEDIKIFQPFRSGTAKMLDIKVIWGSKKVATSLTLKSVVKD